MKVWLLTVGEQLPVDSTNSRLLRTGTLARFLLTAGHQVVWWTSSFNHITKEHRSERSVVIETEPGLRIHLLRGPGYRKHVSVRRLWDHVEVARRFMQWSRREQAPDILVASLPTLELASAAVSYGRSRGIPVVVDIRDLWPDAIAELFPKPLRFVSAILLAPYQWLARYCCGRASAVVGPTLEYMQWGLDRAGRRQGIWDREFPFAYPQTPPSAEEQARAGQFWRELGVRQDSGKLRACFFGTLGSQFDLGTVLAAAKRLETTHPEMEFVICGRGDREGEYRRMAGACRNVLMPGWVGRAEIWELMRMSAIGLAPYHCSPHFRNHIPNKPVEYLSAGLPVLTTLEGALGRLLVQRDCGQIYPEGSADLLEALLRRLHQDPAMRMRMSLNARRLYEERFVAEKVYPRMVSHLEAVARGGIRSAGRGIERWQPVSAHGSRR